MSIDYREEPKIPKVMLIAKADGISIMSSTDECGYAYAHLCNRESDFTLVNTWSVK